MAARVLSETEFTLRYEVGTIGPEIIKARLRGNELFLLSCTAPCQGMSKNGQGTLLRKGLCLAIEPMITEGSYEVATLDDNWTVVTEDGKLAAHFEHTIAITDDGPKILTLRDVAEHPDVAMYRPAQEVAA